MRLLRPKILLCLALSAIGVIAAARNLAAMAGPVESTPLSAIAAYGQETAAPDVATYLALTKYHFVESRLRGRDDTPLQFIAYVLVVTRGTALACATHAPIGEAVERFAEQHREIYEHAAAELAADGLNAERIWVLLQPTIEGLATRHLDLLADKLAGSRRDACRWIADHPAGYADARRYSTHYPRLFKMLVAR